jgi:hypothetical protein
MKKNNSLYNLRNFMDSTAITLYSPIHHQAPQEANEGPDYSYSSTNKTLIITSIALFAIAFVAFVTLVVKSSHKDFGSTGMYLLSTVGMCFGATVGSLTSFGAIILRNADIAGRQLAFAQTCKKPDIQMHYLSSAAQKGNKEAIQVEYMMGQNLMLEALKETNKEVKAHKFEEGLMIFDRSAVHSQRDDAGKYLNTELNIELRNKLITELNDGHLNQHNFEKHTKLYWNAIVNVMYANKMKCIDNLNWEPT